MTGHQASLPLRGTIGERFAEFHARHPEVLDYLVSLARDLQRRGRRRCGIRLLWERARWYFTIERDAGAEYKWNDHFHSRYARLIIEKYPDLAEFFELRRLRAE